MWRQRRLFLDDDPARAAVFLRRYPRAVWVQTVPDCLERLTEVWDEVHLDHDLGGEHFVASARADCGMEVVRWLTAEPRPHLQRTRFTVHSHNMLAAYEMVLRLSAVGWPVVARPFGSSRPGWLSGWLNLWEYLRLVIVPRIQARLGRVESGLNSRRSLLNWWASRPPSATPPGPASRPPLR